eukprot:s1130_g11.t1
MVREVAERSVGLGPVKAMTRRNKAAKAKAEKPAIDSNDKEPAKEEVPASTEPKELEEPENEKTEVEETKVQADESSAPEDLDTTVLGRRVERDALTRLRQHEPEVAALRTAVQQLKEKTVQSAVDLRSMCEDAGRIEGLLQVDAGILSSDAVSTHAEWPAEELRQARALLAAVDAWEEAMQKGRLQITSQGGAEELCAALEALLDSFVAVKDAEQAAHAGHCACVERADLGVDAKTMTEKPLVEALLDKAIELRSSEEAAAERFRSLLLQDSKHRALGELRVEVPVELLQSGGSASQTEMATAQSKGLDPDEVAIPPIDLLKGVEEPQKMDAAQLWHAVHTGDLEIVKAFVRRGACTGKSRDASGHSILWHAITFNHHSLARFMVETFPPGTDDGIEVDEVHQRRGDTLLHLLCLSRSFDAEAAALFKKLATKAPPAVFQKVNHSGLTFAHIAASNLNFWVLTFIFKNFQAQAKALVCADSHPMKHLLQAMPQPVPPPAYQPPVGFPDHFRVAAMLQQDSSGVVPYADVAFDVGPELKGVAAGRFLAHRVVVVAQSPKLYEMLETIPLTELPKERIRAAVVRVDERISQEVWRSILQFIYQGTILQEQCTYLHDVARCFELLFAVLLFRLPEPLLHLAQHSLYVLLPVSSPTWALQVFQLCAQKEHFDNQELRPIRDAAAWLLLHSASKLFQTMDTKDVCETLEKVVKSVERSVFDQPRSTSVQGTSVSKQDLIANSVQGIPQDMLAASMRGIPQDLLSQTLSNTMMGFPAQDDLSRSMMGNVYGSCSGFQSKHPGSQLTGFGQA